jgi:hypothetical protein
MHTARDRLGHAIFFPYQGTTFDSFEEAKEFYNLCSWEVGYGIRTGRGKMNDNNYRTKMDIVCSCEVRDELAKDISIFNSTSKLSVPYVDLSKSVSFISVYIQFRQFSLFQSIRIVRICITGK